MVKKIHWIGLILVTGILLISAGAWYFSSLQKTPAYAMQDITICPGHGLSASLLYIAHDKGYFAEHGLNVTLDVEHYPSAIIATDAVIDGRLQFTVTPEYSAALKMFDTTELRILSVIAESETTTIVARKDKGIQNIQDLEGKKIGVNKKSQSEYFLNRFFVLNGLSMQNVTLVNLKPDETPDALFRGDIDAAAVQEPYPYQMMQKLDKNAISYPIHLGQTSAYVIMCNKTFLQAHPEIARYLLESLLEAEVFTYENNDKAEAIIQKKFGFDDNYMKKQWEQNLLSVGLSQSLIISMDDDARFMIRNKIVNATKIPRYMDYIDPAPLLDLNPASITIIRGK